MHWKGSAVADDETLSMQEALALRAAFLRLQAATTQEEDSRRLEEQQRANGVHVI
jgi:hypothetical protein